MQDGPYCLIPLRRRDKTIAGYTIVDAVDYDWAMRYRWYLHKKGYAGRGEYLGGGAANRRTRQYRMAREILGLTLGDPRQADHINGHRLDNRRSNLRIVTAAENSQNLRQPPGEVPYRGVTRNNSGWSSKVADAYLGTYATAEEAAVVAANYRAGHMPFAVEGRHPAPRSACCGRSTGRAGSQPGRRPS